MYIVYQIIFPNSKSYIGITNNLRMRKSAHKCRVNDDNIKYPLYLAFRKYGFDNVKWKILFEFENLKDAELKEVELIETVIPNYNIASGGMVHKMTDEIKDKISKANSGRVHSKEARQRMSEGHPKTAKPKEKKLPKFSEQACKNMKISRDRKREARIQLILQTYQDGMTLKQLSSITSIPVRTICMYTEEWRNRYAELKEGKENVDNTTTVS